MGILDTLKKLLPKVLPPPPFEPQCARDTYLTIRLPTGWQFTHAEGGGGGGYTRFVAAGPGGCSAEFRILHMHGAERMEKSLFLSAVIRV